MGIVAEVDSNNFSQIELTEEDKIRIFNLASKAGVSISSVFEVLESFRNRKEDETKFLKQLTVDVSGFETKPYQFLLSLKRKSKRKGRNYNNKYF